MKSYDWIVIGGGITGSSLGYELAKKGYSVLLLEKDAIPDNATYYSYGGLAYWSGTTPLTRQLCQEGIEIHRQLSAELEADTEFRELDLVLTIAADNDPQTVLDSYAQFAITPTLLNVKEACELEPLLNPNAIASVLRLPHGHVHPQKTAQSYQQAMVRAGGEIKIAKVLEPIVLDRHVKGVKTAEQNYYAANTVVCAGGLSRFLLKTAGISVPNYFTLAQLIMTPPTDIELRTLVMPAVQKRFDIEAQTNPSSDCPSILDSGAIQFRDRSFCIGQISQVTSSPEAKADAVTGEARIRKGIGIIIPSLQNIPGTWHSCLVAFNNNSIALVGAIENFKGIYLFSGFTSTFVFAPPLARRFANWVAGEEDEIISQLQQFVISSSTDRPI
ncbi:MAG: FAD-binding oxidoreductase [Prochloraceae cyanobacterium]|nr:FAD-binding oxidoreductase [Prochloraceae cyanobacterium]